MVDDSACNGDNELPVNYVPSTQRLGTPSHPIAPPRTPSHPIAHNILPSILSFQSACNSFIPFFHSYNISNERYSS